MQCPRCYFSNPAGTRVCEYCGARFEGTTGTGPDASSSSAKRKTMLGPLPTAPAKSEQPVRRAVPLDPDDPFRIAARGVGETLPVLPAEPPQPTKSEPPSPPSPRLSGRPTLITSRQNLPKAESTPVSDENDRAVAGTLLLIEANGTSRAIVLREGRTRIGRRPDADVVITDAAASSDHALLLVEDSRAWLLDTSANGTLVSGVSCMNDRADIADGSVLVIGSTAIIVKVLSSESIAHIAQISGSGPG